jgi:tyrosine-protein phosphatase YwqE
MFDFLKKNTKEHFDYSYLNTDMHSHLIPGIDDGSPDMETSVKLIKGLSELGYKKLITTPHIMWDIYKNNKKDIVSLYKNLEKKVADENIEIEIGIAAEYFIDDHFKMLLKNKEPLLTIKDNLVLVEFSFANEPIDLKETLFDMQLQGYHPVIAHPERYSYNENSKEFFFSLKNAGYWFQLNILSLAGAYGKSAKMLAQYFIKNNFYELAGTDLHNHHHLDLLKTPEIIPDMKRLLNAGTLKNSNF